MQIPFLSQSPATASVTRLFSAAAEVVSSDSLMSSLPPTSSSPFLSDRKKIDELTPLVTMLENAYDGHSGDTSSDDAIIWRLRATTPKFGKGTKFPPPSFTPFKTPNLEVFQVIQDSGSRIDNVIYVPPPSKLVKTGTKITLVHDASMTRDRTYLTLKSVVLTKVESDALSIWRFGDEEKSTNDKIEDVFGVNVPMAPELLSSFAGLNGFEESFKDEACRITRGGSGFGGVWGGFRVFERIK